MRRRVAIMRRNEKSWKKITQERKEVMNQRNDKWKAAKLRNQRKGMINQEKTDRRSLKENRMHQIKGSSPNFDPNLKRIN